MKKTVVLVVLVTNPVKSRVSADTNRLPSCYQLATIVAFDKKRAASLPPLVVGDIFLNSPNDICV